MEACGYILRIASEEWLNEVFDTAIYYTSVRRKWKPDQTILFVHRTASGDALVGYGVIMSVHERDDLAEEEKKRCDEHNWKKAIEFTYVIRFENPLHIKETFLKQLKLGGRYLHGFSLNGEQLKSVIAKAENRPPR